MSESRSDKACDARMRIAQDALRMPDVEQYWFYLSFVDTTDDENHHFVGGAYIQAPLMESAIPRSHELGLNPGGEVQITGPIPDDAMDESVPLDQRYRLLTREQIQAQG